MKHAELSYQSPVKFSIQQRLSLSILSRAIALAFRVVGWTYTVDVRGRTQFNAIRHATDGKVILAFWHEVLPLAIHSVKGSGFHTLTSYSYDGELIARIVKHFGLGAVRGSSSRGGRNAIRQLSQALKLGITIGVTLDGPRGPRRVAKPGVAILSGRTGAPIVPMVMGAARAWRMRSWDRMVFPKPFTTIVCIFGDPIEPASESSSDEVERIRLAVERELNRLYRELEAELGCEVFL